MNWAVTLAYMADGKWHFGINDADFMSWIISISYLCTVFLCLMAARAIPSTSPPVQKRFWMLLAVVMLALGLNKQLDLQTLVTETGANLAMQQGWYEKRREVQALFILFITIAGVGGLWLVWRLARRTVPQYRLALLGGAFLLCFVLIRAASFHHVDQVLGLRFRSVKLHHCLELSGVFWVALAASRAWSRNKKEKISGMLSSQLKAQ